MVSIVKPIRMKGPTEEVGALQRVAVVAGNDRRWTDLCSQRSCRLIVGAREPQGLAA
jgi:hypothetical protein